MNVGSLKCRFGWHDAVIIAHCGLPDASCYEDADGNDVEVDINDETLPQCRSCAPLRQCRRCKLYSTWDPFEWTA